MFNLTTGGMMIVVVSVLALNKVLGMGWALGIGYGVALGIDKAATKAKIPGGLLQYKLAVLAGHPLTLKYIPVLSKLLSGVWTSAGLPAPPGTRSRYTP
jgi:predicted Rossmann fold nucleotide-binding protein DprA/Smf involved in DNA uptake